MIYLIDDNQNDQRFKNYNITFIEEGVFENHLKSIEKLEIGNSLSDITHLEFLNSAACILLHSTAEDFDINKGFLPSSITNVIKIKEFISQEGELIPLVLFSNSMGEADFDYNVNPSYIRGIKKNLFYERLFEFLEHFKNTGEIELRILSWGNNYAAKIPIELAKQILTSLENKKKTDELLITDLTPVLPILKSFFKISLPDMNLNELLVHLEDNSIKIDDFKKNINQIIESYVKFGKNIHPWK
jgi:hypothetical protein